MRLFTFISYLIPLTVLELGGAYGSTQDSATTTVAPDGNLDMITGKESTNAGPKKRTDVVLFSPDDLKTDKRVLLSCVGHVFDVSTGERFYGSEGSYRVFGRQDASRVYATAQFGLTSGLDNLDGLTPEQLDSVISYLEFYHNHKTYKFVGYLKGRYFDADGFPTEKFKEFESLKQQRAEFKKKQEELLDTAIQ